MVDMNQLKKDAQKRTIILPPLEFSPDGDKFAEGQATVEFLQPTFRPIQYEDRETKEKKEFLVIEVRLLENSDFNQRPGDYQLRTAARNSTLTDNLLQLSERHSGSLMGVRATIQTENYQHKRHGKTRAYRVTEIRPQPPKTTE
jgi:hypothetical protein